MTITGMANLHKLSESDLTVADNSQDVRGRRVLDRNGSDIGPVDDLMIDDREKKVRFLHVEAGGFLGISETTLLVPIDSVTRVTNDAVQIDQTAEHVRGGPRNSPALVNDEHYEGVYYYYGYSPYWAPGYISPAVSWSRY